MSELTSSVDGSGCSGRGGLVTAGSGIAAVVFFFRADLGG